MAIDTINGMESHSGNQSKYQKIRINLIFLFALFIIVALSSISVYQFYNLLNANRWISHTYQVISAAHNSVYHLTYLEARQGEYFLFNDNNYPSTFKDNVLKIEKSLSSLINLTKDNPPQHENTIKLSAQINQKINLLRQMLQINESVKKGSSNAIDILQSSRLLTNEIRSLTNQIVQIEFILLSERNNKAIKNANTTNVIFVSGQVISIIFLLIAFLLFNRELLKRSQAETKIKNIEGELRSIIEGASDMIAALDTNYRFIILNHAYEKEFKRLFDIQIHIGMSLDDAFHDLPEIKDKLKKYWKQSLEGNEFVQTIELDVHDQKVIFEVTSSLIKDSQNKILGAVHIKRNITERMHNQNILNDGMMELKDKNEKITLLLEMSDIMLACSSITELCEIIAKYCNKVLNFSKGVFYIMHPSKNFLEESAIWGSPLSKTNNFMQNQCWALRLGHIHYSGLSDSELICDHVVGVTQDETSYLCVPLRAQNDIYGLLYIEIIKKEEKQQLTSNERLLVNAFAELAALALANVRLRENLSYQSVRDPLTSLYNRRYLEEFLLKQIYQSERTKKPLAVLMLDLDHFKRINDIHGHDAGDLILKQVAQLLIQAIRPGDLAARYGGEEFIIVLYDTDAKTAAKRAEFIRKSISLLLVKFGAQDTGEITASIGVSEYPQDGETGTALIESADKALYVAKNSGRNRVILFSEVLIKEKIP